MHSPRSPAPPSPPPRSACPASARRSCTARTLARGRGGSDYKTKMKKKLIYSTIFFAKFNCFGQITLQLRVSFPSPSCSTSSTPQRSVELAETLFFQKLYVGLFALFTAPLSISEKPLKNPAKIEIGNLINYFFKLFLYVGEIFPAASWTRLPSPGCPRLRSACGTESITY